MTDVDKTWDGTIPLDEHRQKEFAKIQQPGFGELPVKSGAVPAAVQPAPQQPSAADEESA